MREEWREVCLAQKWGKICDDSWGDDDAGVVCRQLPDSKYHIVLKESPCSNSVY